jgi:hypothetical protein
MQAMPTLRKPVALFLATAILVVVAPACFGGGEPVEYLHRPDTILIQMTSSRGLPAAEYQHRPELPDFTLYGDGTLLLSSEANDATTLLRSRLSPDSVLDLLSEIRDTGFFDFNYEQPEIPVTDGGSTLIYVNTRTAANAVSAYALGAEIPEGDEWDEFRRLEGIKARLDEVAGQAGEDAGVFQPEGGMLEIIPLFGDPADGEPWPFPQLDIATAAPGLLPSTYTLRPNEFAALDLTNAGSTHCWCEVQHTGRLFSVYYRPILPFEENFPEFYRP